jgi:phosphatidylglycerol---prolipoprotein diacylglyceryl transferase
MIAFNIFNISIHWYGIIIAVGLLLAILLAMYHTKREGHDPDSILDMALIVVPLAVICARIYYVVFQWNSFYSTLPFTEVFAVWHGGLAIYGAVIGGILGVWIYCRFVNKKFGFIKLLDILVPSLILGQAIGRWGNFVNQEAYGAAITNPAWQWFPAAVHILNPQIPGEQPGWYMATFFYESMWNFLVFGFLFFYFKNSKNRKTGNVFLFYLLLYGLGRVVIEGLRTDSLMLGTIRISQLLSGLLVIAAAAVLIFRYVKTRHAEMQDTPLDARFKLHVESSETDETVDAAPVAEDSAENAEPASDTKIDVKRLTADETISSLVEEEKPDENTMKEGD